MMVTLSKKCWHCKRIIEVEVPYEGYRKWKTGTLIQDAMPTVLPSDRELLISGTCSECFHRIFPEGEDY